jgi:hypothetical protein
MRDRAEKRTQFPAGGKGRGAREEWSVAREQWPVANEIEEAETTVIEKRQNEANCSWY